MVSDSFERFLTVAAVGTLLAFVLGAILTPPDPFSQLRYLAVALPIVWLFAYVVSYRFDAS